MKALSYINEIWYTATLAFRKTTRTVSSLQSGWKHVWQKDVYCGQKQHSVAYLSL